MPAASIIARRSEKACTLHELRRLAERHRVTR